MYRDINFEEIPNIDYYLSDENGYTTYKGKIGFINGWNGYTRTKNDGMMCALINNSLWTNQTPNLLYRADGCKFNSTNRRSQTYEV